MQLKRVYQARNHSDKENLFQREKKRCFKSTQLLPQPKELMYKILLYLNPKEINVKFKSLNSQCYKLIDQQFWDFYDQKVGLNFNDLYEIQYRIIERRSKGSLYRVMHRLTEKQYVLRSIDTIKSNSDYNDGYQTSLIRELTYLQLLSQHPRIQQLMDVSFQGPNVKLIYEFIPQNLRDKLKSELSQEQIKNYFVQICQGVEFLHSHHIIHRNLKPDNILVGQNIKIGDLSLARKETFPIIKYTPEDPKDRMRSNREIKRLGYRAPELLVRKNYYATEIDIWSLGCILAELALGKPLFQSQTEIQHLYLVFQLLGTPQKGLSDQQDFNIKFPVWQGYGLNLEDMTIEQVNELKKNRPNVLKQIMQLNQVLGLDGINLLQKCLNLNPYDRPSITEILQHPFLNSKPYNYIQNPRSFQVQDYLQFQQEITYSMRATLVDWLIDVSLHFQQQSETLHLSINTLDSVLSIVFSSKRSLQLYGITCLHLADLYYEVSREYYRQQNCEAYSYITDDEYAPQEIIKASQIILKAMDYNLCLESSLHYFSLEIQIRKIQDQSLVSTGLYLCDYYLMCYDLIRMDKRTLGFYILLLSAWTSQIKIGSINQLDIDLLIQLKKSHDELKQNPNCGQLEACQQKHQKTVEIPEISDFIIQFFK